MKKIILKPIAFSMILTGFLSSFGGCSDKISPSSSHNADFTFNCVNEGMLLEAKFDNETVIDDKYSKYTFESIENNTKITFTHETGLLNASSTIALTKNGNLERYMITDKVNLANGEAKYVLQQKLLNDGGSKIKLEVVDCAHAFAYGDQLGIEVMN